MLRETRNQLTKHKVKMNISFVLMADQQNVYNAFIKHLNEMQTVDPVVSQKLPTKKKVDPSTIAYDQNSKK